MLLVFLLGLAWAPAEGRATTVALGDSYSSGEGAGSYDADTNHDTVWPPRNVCHRSKYGWARLLGVEKEHHLACSGAKIEHLSKGQMRGAPDNVGQLQRLRGIAARDHVDRVFLGIGGNDISDGLSKIIGDCWYKECLKKMDDVELRRLHEKVGPAVVQALRDVGSASNGAEVVLVGYPDIIPPEGNPLKNCGWIEDHEKPRIRRLEAALDAQLAAAASIVSARYISIRESLSGHELCTKNSWINPVNPARYGTDTNQGHPNKSGQQAIAHTIRVALNRPPTSSPAQPQRPPQQTQPTPPPAPAAPPAPLAPPVNRAPVITGVSPAPGAIVGSNAPRLDVVAHDDDGEPLQRSYRLTGPSTDLSSGWVDGAWTVPAHKLDPGTRYDWTVSVRDARGATDTATSWLRVAMLPTATELVSVSTGDGYWQVASDGGVFSYGSAQFYGSVPGLGKHLTNIMGLARTPDDKGYWLVGSDGGVFAFGDAPFAGSLPAQNVHVDNIVGMAPTKDGRGYWLVGSDGGVFSFGTAAFYGSKGGQHLNAPVARIAPTASGNGYWLVARDGGIFSFGDAAFYGSMGGQPLQAPIIDIDVAPDGAGYWLTAEDGGVFTFGSAHFHGALASQPLNGHITSMSPTADGGGYWLNGCDGGIFTFGNAVFYGSNPIDQCRGTSPAPPPPPPAPPPPPGPRSSLGSDETLQSGASLASSDGHVVAMQADGNLVVIAPGNHALWSTHTNGNPGAIARMQGDGNFVVIAPGNHAVWDSHTGGHPGAIVRIQDDGNLVVVAPGNQAIWDWKSRG